MPRSSRLSPAIRSFLNALRSVLHLRDSLPPYVYLNDQRVHYIASESDSAVSWAPVTSAKRFTAVIPADERQILLGWRKASGHGRHHFGAFAVRPQPGESVQAAAARDLKDSTGLTALNMVVAGRILYVDELTSEAREVVIYRATSWTGNLVETGSYIPARFHIPQLVNSPTSTSFASTSTSSISTDSTESLPSFLDMSVGVPKPSLSLHSIVSSIFLPLWNTRSLSAEDCLPDLLPWHCMHPDDKLWYPMLISGKKFVGRVDYGRNRELRKWWFAEVEDI